MDIEGVRRQEEGEVALDGARREQKQASSNVTSISSSMAQFMTFLVLEREV